MAGADGRPVMEILEQNEGPAVVVTPVGRLDSEQAPYFEARITAIVRRGDHRIVLDGSRMTYISSAGLRVIVLGAKGCHHGGGRLSIAALGPECRTVLDASGLLSFLDYHPTVKAALAEAKRPRIAGALPQRNRPEAFGETGMEIGERREGEVVVLSLAGHLDSVTAPDLEARVAAVIGQGGAGVVLDCSRMSYVNSCGLRALLVSARACSQKGEKLVISDLQDRCRQVMGMSGFLSIIDCQETLVSALAAVAPMEEESNEPPSAGRGFTENHNP